MPTCALMEPLVLQLAATYICFSLIISASTMRMKKQPSAILRLPRTTEVVLLLVYSYPVKLGIVGLSTHRLSVSKLTLPIKHGAAMDI